METIVLAIHLLIALALVAVVLLQRSEGGGLGMGGSGGGGMGGFMTGRATADLLTRTTAILAASFMATSVVLAILADSGADQGSILDQLQRNSGSESEEQAPSVPLAE